MPVIRGSLRQSGDGSIKNFVIILTVIGFLCFIYYKLKISPNCIEHMTILKECRVEINRLNLIIQGLKEQIEQQKAENAKLVEEERSRAAQLDAARTSDSDKTKEINQLKDDLMAANEKLERYGSVPDLASKKMRTRERGFGLSDTSADAFKQTIDEVDESKPNISATGIQLANEYQAKGDIILRKDDYHIVTDTARFSKRIERAMKLLSTGDIISIHNESVEKPDVDSKNENERRPTQENLEESRPEAVEIELTRKTFANIQLPERNFKKGRHQIEMKKSHEITLPSYEEQSDKKEGIIYDLQGQNYSIVESSALKSKSNLRGENIQNRESSNLRRSSYRNRRTSRKLDH